jgi:hypothetical protein
MTEEQSPVSCHAPLHAGHPVLRFRSSNHIDASANLVLRSAHLILRRACPTWGARLEGLRASRRTATRETEPAAILRDGALRLLRMRSVGLSLIRPIRSRSDWFHEIDPLVIPARKVEAPPCQIGRSVVTGFSTYADDDDREKQASILRRRTYGLVTSR